jgi:hypothetical protein
MTAPAPARTDFDVLDGHIAQALCTLRMARAVSARGGTPADLEAEEQAEACLNAFLDCRLRRTTARTSRG